MLDLIHAVMHQYRSQQYQVLRDGPHDITHMESKVLRYFQRHPGATQSDFARHSGRDKAQAARLIHNLRERGLLDSTPDASDRRNVRLTATEAGQSLQALLQRQAGMLNAKAVQGLSDDERELLLAFLRRVKRNLDQQD